MRKDSFEKLDDWFLNLYEEWIFVRCFEYSAIFVSELTWYRLFANIDRKTGKIFLEIGFPNNKLNQIIKELEMKWYCLRITKLNWELKLSFWVLKLERNIEKLIKLKQDLVKFC
jgi:hypothetical protein